MEDLKSYLKSQVGNPIRLCLNSRNQWFPACIISVDDLHNTVTFLNGRGLRELMKAEEPPEISRAELNALKKMIYRTPLNRRTLPLSEIAVVEFHAVQ